MARGISVIPKSKNPERLKENFLSGEFLLDDEIKRKFLVLIKDLE